MHSNAVRLIASRRSEAGIEQRLNIVRQAAQDLLYASILAAVFVMSFYVYLKALMPITPYIKDALLFSVALGTITNTLVSERIRAPRPMDWILLLLAIQLVCEIIYTAEVANVSSAYYGFRLTFLPVVLYFGFRSIECPSRQRRIYRLMFSLLVIGVFVTLLEAIVVQSGIISRTTMFKIASASESIKEYDFGGFFRPIGIAGTPHITGVYNIVAVAMLFFANSAYLGGDGGGGSVIGKKMGKWLLFVAIAAVILSTSRTAITILVVLLFFLAVTGTGNRGRMMLWTIIAALGFFAYYLWWWLLESGAIGAYVVFGLSYWKLASELVAPVYQRSPLFGFGYEVGSTVGLGKIRLENVETSSDFFFVQVFKMLGGVGLGLLMIVFIVMPVLAICARRASLRDGTALGLLSIGLSFAHYNPLQMPALAVVAWFLCADLAGGARWRSHGRPMSKGNVSLIPASQ